MSGMVKNWTYDEDLVVLELWQQQPQDYIKQAAIKLKRTYGSVRKRLERKPFKINKELFIEAQLNKSRRRK